MIMSNLLPVKPSGHRGGTYKGRTFKAPSQADQIICLPISDHTSLDAICDSLENDSVTPSALKRGVIRSQEQDLELCREQLLLLRKTHDRLHAEANILEFKYSETQKRLNEINRICNTDIQGNCQNGPSKASPICDVNENSRFSELQKRLKRSDELFYKAVVRREQFDFMARRLQHEVLEIKRKTQLIEGKIHSGLTEYASKQGQCQVHNQELLKEQYRFSEMNRLVQASKLEQATAIRKFKKVVQTRKMQLTRQEKRLKERDNAIACANGGINAKEYENLNKSYLIRELYGEILQQKIQNQELKLEDLESKFSYIRGATGLTTAEQIIHNFKEKSSRTAKMDKLIKELKVQIEDQRNQNISQKLALDELKTKSSIEALSANLKAEGAYDDFALSFARKKCNSSLERAKKVQNAVNSLRNSLVRFHAKIEGEALLLPDDNNLAKVLEQLESKIMQLQMKNAGGCKFVSCTIGQVKENFFPMVGSDKFETEKALPMIVMAAEPKSARENIRVTPRRPEVNKMVNGANSTDSSDEVEEFAICLSKGTIRRYLSTGEIVDRAFIKKLSALLQGRVNGIQRSKLTKVKA